MERWLLSAVTNEKTITNPLNKTEVFTCADLYKDYKKCRAMYRKGQQAKSTCRSIRSMGLKCYTNTEEDFEKFLAKKFDDKMKYITYLKNEGSILYNKYKSDPLVFSVKKCDEKIDPDVDEEVNDYITSKTL